MARNRSSSAWIRLSVCGLGLVLFTGCGGGGGNGGGGGGTPTTVTFTFRGATPGAVAVKIGSGAFAAQTLSSGVLTISVPDGTSQFVLAYACPAESFSGALPDLTAEYVFAASGADGTSFEPACPSTTVATPQTGTLTGSVDASAIQGAIGVELAAGTAGAFMQAGAPLNGAFSVSLPAGNDRVEVLALKQGTLPGTTSLVAARNFSSQTVPGALNGGNPIVLGAADQTTLFPITYSNLPSGFSQPQALVGFAMGSSGSFVVASAAADQYPALPAGVVESGDFYIFVAISTDFSLQSEQFVSAGSTSATAGPVALTFPAPWSYAGPSPAALPSFAFNYPGFSGKSGVYETAEFLWESGTAANACFLVATAAYQNGATTVPFPDLSGLTGFLPVPGSGSRVTWTASITQSSFGPFHPRPAGATWSAVGNGGFYAVP